MGSGISGMITARDAPGFETRIIAVVADNAPAYAVVFQGGQGGLHQHR